MFSGIVEEIGKVRAARAGEGGTRLAIEAGALLEGVSLGESIAVNGACLTVVAAEAGCFEADVSPETLRRTNLGALRAGDRCNLERALALGDRLGGHMVSGHIDETGTIRDRRPEGDSVWLTFAAPAAVMRYIVLKGSVAVDGISLTVAACDAETFSVAIIPHTEERTTLLENPVGAAVNLEADLIGKYVEKLLGPHAGEGAAREGLSLAALKAQGYA